MRGESAQPSRTALITCLMRALHTKYDRPALIQDAWADRLMTGEERNALASMVMGAASPSNCDNLGWRASRTWVSANCRGDIAPVALIG
jgi:O-methyltransferase involved in polyketide biosynthesis